MVRSSICCALLLLAGPSVAAEEAVDLTGRRQRGHLVHEQGVWFFRDLTSKQIATKDLSYVRFEPAAALTPKVPLYKTLLLANGQRLTGSLLKIDKDSIEFAAARTKSHVVRRDQVVGIVHADDWLPLVYEDFEAPLKGWKIAGAADLDLKWSYFGKQSLPFHEAGQSVSREWPSHSDVRISFFVSQTTKALPPRLTVEVLSQADETSLLMIDKAGLFCKGVRQGFGTLQVKPEWRHVAIECQAGSTRFYVDDQCLGQTPLPKGIHGIRFSTKDAADGRIWIDEFCVARRLPTLPMPKNDATQDSVWLEHGEQLFGRLVGDPLPQPLSQRARGAMVLDAKFGKRTFAWSQVRGIGFAEGKRVPLVGDVEVTFRPGSGCSADRLHVKLLRWDDAKLIVDHAVLGEIAIERARLETVRFEAK